MKGLLRLLIPLLIALPAGAAELFEYQRPISAMGMGGVYLPFVKSTDAVLWNPAALGDVEELAWEIMNINGGFGGSGANPQEMMESYQSIGSCQSESGSSNCFSELYGKPIWMNYGGKSSFAAPGFGFAGYNFGYIGGVLNNPAYPSMSMTFINDYGFSIGTGFRVAPTTSLGVAVKRINRWGGTQSVGLSTITSGSSSSIVDSFTNRGVAYGFDLGTQTKLSAGPFNTVFGVAWQDVGSTAFTMTDGVDAPPRIKDNLALGLGAGMDLPGLDFKVGAEIRHITATGEQFGKKLHLGAELGLPFIDVRTGLNQGYPTYGASFDIFFMTLDIASYATETGAYPGQTPVTRLTMGLTMEFSIDADFKFTAKDGKRRKLKQRR